MATKTWKLGEVCKGGIITVEINGTTITVIGKDWDFSAGSSRGSNQSNAKEWIREDFESRNINAHQNIYNLLSDLTTSYYSSKILEWIESKVTLG